MTTHPTGRPRPRTLLLLLGLLTALVVPLAACATLGARNGSGAADAGSASSADAGATAEAPAAAPEGALADEGADAAGTAPRVEPMQRAVVSTGRLELRSDDVGRARAQAVRLVRGYGGLVAEEESSSADGATAYTSLTVRVPSERFETAMTELARLGEVVDQARTAEDVTTQVVDTAARIRAQERSVRRVEQLLAQAEDLGDVIAIESDLARRQGDLDSLKSQRAYLDDQTSLSTITIGIDRAGGAPEEDDGAGFLTGLDRGWSALVAATATLATVLGAVLPFAVVLLLLGVPAWLVVRRRRGHRAPPVAPTPA